MITIGKQKLPTRRPADLDDQLIAATGHNAAETAAHLRRGGTAFQVARSLAPLLADAPAIGDLSATISEDDLPEWRRQVADLLDQPATAKEPARGE